MNVSFIKLQSSVSTGRYSCPKPPWVLGGLDEIQPPETSKASNLAEARRLMATLNQTARSIVDEELSVLKRIVNPPGKNSAGSTLYASLRVVRLTRNAAAGVAECAGAIER